MLLQFSKVLADIMTPPDLLNFNGCPLSPEHFLVGFLGLTLDLLNFILGCGRIASILGRDGVGAVVGDLVAGFGGIGAKIFDFAHLVFMQL